MTEDRRGEYEAIYNAKKKANDPDAEKYEIMVHTYLWVISIVDVVLIHCDYLCSLRQRTAC